MTLWRECTALRCISAGVHDKDKCNSKDNVAHKSVNSLLQVALKNDNMCA